MYQLSQKENENKSLCVPLPFIGKEYSVASLFARLFPEAYLLAEIISPGAISKF